MSSSAFSEAGLDNLRSLLRSEIKDGVHHGSVVVLARGGEIALFEAQGSTDVATGREAKTTDIFMTMSLAKAFTASLVLRAIERAELGFDTRVADVVPEFAVGGKQNVTIAQLLTHTSGTWAGFAPPAPFSFDKSMDHDAMVRAVCAQPLAHIPGERVVYNPFASFTMLGEVLRRIDASGRGFVQIAQEDLFSPLSMVDSSYGLSVDHPRRVPVRMVDRVAGAATADVMESLNQLAGEGAVHPAGGSFSTAADVFRFADALRQGGSIDGHRLLSPAMVEYAYRNHTGDMSNHFWDFSREARGIADFPANFSYGGGYVRGTGDHLTALGRLASARTFGAVGSGSTMWLVDPDRDVTLVYLAAGLTEGLHHFQRLQKIADAAIGAAA